MGNFRLENMNQAFKNMNQAFKILWIALAFMLMGSDCGEPPTIIIYPDSGDHGISSPDDGAASKADHHVGATDDGGSGPDPGTLNCDSATDRATTCPCDENAQCQSTYCIPTSEGKRCGGTCTDSCDVGFACELIDVPGQDATFICVDRSLHLCRPCATNEDCQGTWGDPMARCLSIGAPDYGSFCGISCSTDDNCPGTHYCAGLSDENGEYSQCIPLDGICKCNTWAQLVEASTPCYRGECVGSRTCVGANISECDAQESLPESCDGLDNDCNGTIDDPFLVGGFYTANEHCGSCDNSCVGLYENATSVCGIVNGLPGCVLGECNPGFSLDENSQCVASMDPPCGTPEAQCEPGAGEALACGNCGEQTRSCYGNCVWGDWGACGSEGDCAVGQQDSESQSCGSCGTQSRTRQCTAGCSWDAWSEWSQCDEGGGCTQGASETQTCGNCGTQTRTCGEGCVWGSWGACTGEGSCEAGTTDSEVQGCGSCGSQTRSRSCSQDCLWEAWGAWSVCNEGGSCTLGQTENQSQACGNCGSQDRDRSCNESCLWDAWSSWGACSGEGSCAAGAADVQTQACGNCGSQDRSRACTSDCVWGGWGSWGSCGGEGSCAPGATDSSSCGNCGVKTRICTSDCVWGAWGSCVGSGACSAGSSDTEACGTCGAKTRYCDASCSWGGFGSCEINPGWCYINEECHPNGTPSPNGCSECNYALSNSSWSPSTTGDSCTQCMGWGHCKADGACGSSVACDDGLWCTAATGCESGSCGGGSILEVACLINGVCYSAGAESPNGCAQCDPTVSATAWSPKTTAETCTPCMGWGYCQGDGTCGSDVPCDDGLPCTTGSVCGVGGCGGGTMLSGTCYISGTCYGPGEKSPNGCSECTPLVSTIDWTPSTTEDSCTPCMGWGHCTSSGSCASAVSCSDGDACTFGTTCQSGSCTGGSSVGACSGGDTEWQDCGFCGFQYRSCTAFCSWGAWGSCIEDPFCE